MQDCFLRKIALIGIIFLSIGSKENGREGISLSIADHVTTRLSSVDKTKQKSETFRGVLDRIEDNGMAVILIEEIDREIVLSIKDLPLGSKEGVWFEIQIGRKNDIFTVVDIDVEKTNEQWDKSMKLIENLRKKSN